MRLLYISSFSVSKSDPGSVSACTAEVDSSRLCLRASSVAISVVRESAVLAIRSTRGVDELVRDVRCAAASNSPADGLISTLRRFRMDHGQKYTLNTFPTLID